MAEQLINPYGFFPQSYHYSWLGAHPERSFEWLRDRISDGFHIHHVDGDHGNDTPTNLLLIDGVDHLRLHGMKLRDGIKSWRKRRAAKLNEPTASIIPELDPASIGAMLSRIRSA